MLCVDLLEISVFHHEGQRDHICDGNMHALRNVVPFPQWILSFKGHVREISANACLLLKPCFQRQILPFGNYFLRNCQFHLRTKSRNT